MKPQTVVKTMVRRRIIGQPQIVQPAPQPGLLSKLSEALSNPAPSAPNLLSRLATPSPTPSRAPGVFTAKATGHELGYGDLRPMVYREPKIGQSHYLPPAPDDLASKVSGFLASKGTDVSPSRVSDILSKLKIPALGALGVAAVAGLVIGAMKLYDKFKQDKEKKAEHPAPEMNASEQPPAGSGYRRRGHRSGRGLVSA